jgi:hypothetical protein
MHARSRTRAESESERYLMTLRDYLLLTFRRFVRYEDHDSIRAYPLDLSPEPLSSISKHPLLVAIAMRGPNLSIDYPR